MKRFWTTILSVLLAVGACFTFSGCKQREDCIPKTLGKAEGLYLYYDNYRSLTDGTKTERLLNDITVNEVTYSTDEYEIANLAYMTSKKEIFYSLETQKAGEETKYFLWHYNYDTKENGWLYTFEDNMVVYTSEYYVLARDYDGYGGTKQSVLFDGDLNFISDEFSGGKFRLEDDYLYCENTVGMFAWWKDGKFFEIRTEYEEITTNDILLTGDYAYLFYGNKLFLVDMNTGEYKTHLFSDGETMYDRTGYMGRRAYFDHRGDKRYCITSSEQRETNYEFLPLHTSCTLWVLEKLEITRLYAFDEKYQVEFSDCNDNYLNFEIERYNPLMQDKSDTLHGYYDLETNRFVKGKTQAVKREEAYFQIGEYEFYTNSVHYGPIMWNFRCYYLHRIYNGKDEILQYHFDEMNGRELNPVLFDDIYTK